MRVTTLAYLASGSFNSYNPPDEMPEMRNKGQQIEDAGFDEFCVWHAHQTEDKGSRYKDPIIFQNGKYRDDTMGKYGDEEFCNYIIDFIDRKKDDDNPFFVYWPMALTHKPHEPSPDSPEFADFDPPTNRTRGGRTWAELEDGAFADDPRFYKDMGGVSRQGDRSIVGSLGGAGAERRHAGDLHG